MRNFRGTLVFLAVFALAAAALQTAISCPFCSAPSLTLTEQVAQSDAVVLAQWVSATMPEGQAAGSTVYEVVSIVKDPATAPPKKKDPKDPNVAQTDAVDLTVGNNSAAAGIGPLLPDTVVKTAGGSSAGAQTFAAADKAAEVKKDENKTEKKSEPAPAPSTTDTKSSAAQLKPLQKGEHITLARYRSGKKGDLFLLTGTMGTVIEWGSPLEVTETSFNYVTQAPSTETAPETRLAYFVKFLEFPDTLISNDAYAEFANAPYKNFVPIAKQLPREKLRKWLSDPQTPQTRLGLYGMMLGLCGTPEDAELMEHKIGEKTEDFRLGIDGIIGGYLLLKGEAGLKFIDETKLRNRQVPFSETYAAMQALRFMWNYGEGVIEKERLRASMRTLLDRPELADLVIADLARWEDWTVQDRLMGLYGAEAYDIPSIKRAIIRYMLVSAKYKKKDDKEEPPAHVALGKKHLETLRAKDPKTVKDAERFFFLN